MTVRSPALTVVSPCPLTWEELAGNDRVRFCGHCGQNVYDVASLTTEEAVALISAREGRTCMRLQRRADGTVVTRDCLTLVRRARQRVLATALGIVAMAAGFWGSVAMLRRWIAGGTTPTAIPCPAPLPARAELPGPPSWVMSPPAPPAPAPPKPRKRAPRMKGHTMTFTVGAVEFKR